MPAMRAMWKGAVSFGLVNVPVKLYSATQEHDIRFHQVHAADGGRIKMRRVCSVCGEEVAWDQLAKGYEAEDGRVVILSDDDLEQLPISTSREIDVVEFVPADQVDPVLFGKTYYLEPDGRAVKPYALLREALAQTERVGIVRVALRQRESLAVLRVRDDVIVLQTLLWPDEIRAAEFDVLSDSVELRPQELTMAASLVESLAADFDPSQYTDAYQVAVRELVEAKLEGVEPVAVSADEAGSDADVVDLLTALQRSVERAKAARGEPSAAAPSEPAAKKTTAKKATARKASASKATVDASGDEDAAPAKKTAKRSTRKSA